MDAGKFLTMAAAFLAAIVWISSRGIPASSGEQGDQGEMASMKTSESIVLGGGCFWCLEAIFQGFRGVGKIESGYSGGDASTAKYDSVGDGDTGHAEVVRVHFDPAAISLEQLLTVFFHAHDPTTLNRQGNDVGPQYRSVIFYASPEQKAAAERVRAQIAEEHVWGDKAIVTEISPLNGFFRAEEYHQNYYANNPNQGYCSIIIAPKVQKIRREFSTLLAH